MNPDVQFRSTDQEVEKLLEECQILRSTLKEISSQISRMENRVKRAFPAPAARVSVRQRERSAVPPDGIKSSLTPEEALAEFDKIVKVASNDPPSAERLLLSKPTAYLVAIARELGISFRKGKPSRRAVQEALYGKIRESILLSKHTARNPAA